jgi:hypothetical protein
MDSTSALYQNKESGLFAASRWNVERAQELKDLSSARKVGDGTIFLPIMASSRRLVNPF